MYTRKILSPCSSPIENGIPVQGTWDRAFDEVNLLDIHRPYLLPLPRWFRDSRIKEWECLGIQDDRFMLEAFLANVKLYRLAQVFLVDKESGERFVFRKLIPGTGWVLPRSLSNASVESRSFHFFFRIHNWLDADTIKLDLNIEARGRQPALTVHLAYNMSPRDVTPMAVFLNFTGRRAMYAFKALAAVRGDMVFGGQHISLEPGRCSGFFCDYKGFFPYRLRTTVCSATGFYEGRRFGFHIAENQTKETLKNNENALWVDGRLTPLPPVRITMPGGPESDWIIQDLEGMVDLVFTPKKPNRAGTRLFFTSADFDVLMGLYNGMLVSAEGAQIQARNLWGMGERLYLRV
ncbi:MAG: DUF2804 domain-containing protein [Treponema sp.]|jgi:hypothetical protein|nr:DUF2804 domain-containing protein [Treponema sp.]